ncbi:hypothetical protein CPB86DRAFT_729877 [Serendipita vermifera]|nr:hypothetical protein CPB86DRAFT_729877 [Serendipita vermifera]
MVSLLKDLPDLGRAATDIADNVHTIVMSLSDLQKNIGDPNPLAFTNVRTELKKEWESLRVYLQRCRSFGEDVLMLKDALGEESKKDLIGFLSEMKASALELQEMSGQLKNKDTSEALSKAVVSNMTERSTNFSPEGIQNTNLRAFIAFVGKYERKSLQELDKALPRLTSNIETVYRIWELTSKGCSSLIADLNDRGYNITVADIEGITFNWKGYQEGIDKAIVSITKSSDAILVTASGSVTPHLRASHTTKSSHDTLKKLFNQCSCLSFSDLLCGVFRKSKSGQDSAT